MFWAEGISSRIMLFEYAAQTATCAVNDLDLGTILAPYDGLATLFICFRRKLGFFLRMDDIQFLTRKSIFDRILMDRAFPVGGARLLRFFLEWKFSNGSVIQSSMPEKFRQVTRKGPQFLFLEFSLPE